VEEDAAELLVWRMEARNFLMLEAPPAASEGMPPEGLRSKRILWGVAEGTENRPGVWDAPVEEEAFAEAGGEAAELATFEGVCGEDTAGAAADSFPPCAFVSGMAEWSPAAASAATSEDIEGEEDEDEEDDEEGI
jgi:hypothetical protein